MLNLDRLVFLDIVNAHSLATKQNDSNDADLKVDNKYLSRYIAIVNDTQNNNKVIDFIIYYNNDITNLSKDDVVQSTSTKLMIEIPQPRFYVFNS